MRKIMKKTIIFAAFAALVLASACSERVDIPELLGENVISLDLVYGDPATRADNEPKTTPGEGLENAVTSVQYFFYNDVTENPIYNSGLITNPTISEDLKYSVTLVAGENGVPDLTTMFKNGECIVFAVFNMPSAITAAPLEDVKATAISNTFAHEDGVEGASSGSEWVVTTDAEAVDYDKYFVMVGELPLTRDKNATTYAAKGTVAMNRVAAKIAVSLKIKKEVEASDGVIWNPMLGGQQIRVYPNFMAGNAVIGGASETPTFPTDLGQFTYKEVVYNSEVGSAYVEDSEDGDYYVIASQQDFYTYPMEWTRGTDVEPFIKVIIPWRDENGTSQKEIYYKIMLPMESIEANKYYKLTVNASILGTEGEPEVTLEPLSALVVSWQGGAPVNGTISAAKYLSVERGVVSSTATSYDTAEGRFDFYTVTSGTDFAASDPVTVRIKEIKQKNLSTGNWEYLYQNFTANNSEITKRGFTKAQVDANWVKLVGDNYLEIGHQLNSDLTSPLMDVTPYYYTVVLSLPSEIDSSHEYDKTVTFVQWPEVYVVEDPNKSSSNTYGYTFLNTYTGNSTMSNSYNNRTYYTYLNGEYGYYLGGIHGLTGENVNGNMYVLTVSVSNNYVIGDPRSATTSVPSFTFTGERINGNEHDFNGTWNSAPWYEGGNHVLTYYRPVSSTNTINMIAPKIRVASSYGVCTTGISQANAIARCAAYQEDGIPAGRWRLPTFSEVEFISTLSSLGRIPYLFGRNSATQSYDSYYFCANGVVHVNNGTKTVELKTVQETSNNNRSVRCVYDEWFWGDATESRPVNAATFTWGDRQVTAN
jgi:hypothetical protein